MIRPKRNPKKVSVIRAGPPLLALLMAVGFVASSSRAEKALAVPSPAIDEASKQESSATAVFAGGCFWGVQGASSNM
jgi:peptide-methionine (S)-S-oxide reductase